MTLDEVKTVEDFRKFCGGIYVGPCAYYHPEVCNLLMNLDAYDYAQRSGLPLRTVHRRFTGWAQDGNCPYYYYDCPPRMIHFIECPRCWSPIPGFDYDMAYDMLYALWQTVGDSFNLARL